MKVLVLFESSGTVRNAFTSRDHDAYSCDLLPSETAGKHFQCDFRDPLELRWDLIIAHPPCTYLSVSGLHWNKRGRMVDGRPRAELTAEALDVVRLLMSHPCQRIAIENPIGCVSTRIRKPEQIIQPYQFGADASKATCLWLKGLSPLRHTDYIAPRWVCCGLPLDIETVGKYGCANCHGTRKPLPRWSNQTDSGQNKLGPGPTRWRERSRTYPGIASAMAGQWGESL